MRSGLETVAGSRWVVSKHRRLESRGRGSVERMAIHRQAGSRLQQVECTSRKDAKQALEGGVQCLAESLGVMERSGGEADELLGVGSGRRST